MIFKLLTVSRLEKEKERNKEREGEREREKARKGYRFVSVSFVNRIRLVFPEQAETFSSGEVITTIASANGGESGFFTNIKLSSCYVYAIR